MIQIKCDTGKTALLTEMIPFQGNLKRRSKDDLRDLGDSLINDGLLMPFALWRQKILDGHGRRESLLSYVADKDPTVLDQEYPIIEIEAETEEEARKALLQITSTYGKFDKKAVVEFATPIVGYKAPVVIKAQHVVPTRKVVTDDKVTIRIRVPRDSVERFVAIIKQVDGVEVN